MSRSFLLLLALILTRGAFAAGTLADSARALARRALAAVAAAEPVQFTLRNASAQPEAALGPAREAFDAEFRTRPAAPNPAQVEITLTEDPEGLLWVAEILRGGKREAVLMERAGAPGAEAEAEEEPPLVLERTLLWESAEPILDAAATETEMAVLAPAGVTLFTREAGTWKRRKALPIADAQPSRDPRGRLVLAPEQQLRVLLPAVACAGKLGAEPALECKPAQEPWPGLPPGAVLGAGGNTFTVPGGEPFFAAAPAGEGWVLAGLDGSAGLFDRELKRIGAAGLAAGDVAPVAAGCVSGAPLVVASSEAPSGSLQAWELRPGQAVAASEPLEFQGQIRALWPADAGAAVVVVRDPGKDRYAAFRVSVRCGR